MKQPIEQHLANFLRLMAGPQMTTYRKRCLLLWREVYGEALTRKAWGLAKAGSGKGNANADASSRRLGEMA